MCAHGRLVYQIDTKHYFCNQCGAVYKETSTIIIKKNGNEPIVDNGDEIRINSEKIIITHSKKQVK